MIWAGLKYVGAVAAGAGAADAGAFIMAGLFTVPLR